MGRFLHIVQVANESESYLDSWDREEKGKMTLCAGRLQNIEEERHEQEFFTESEYAEMQARAPRKNFDYINS